MELILAPLAGITGCQFRTIFTRYFTGIDSAVSPFITTVVSDHCSASHFQDILPANNPAMPVVPQILGRDPVRILNLARQIFDLGYNHVNLNLGCPHRKITRKTHGAGLLSHPDTIKSILDTIFTTIPNNHNVSIKTRLGAEKPDEFFSLIPIFNNYPLKSITIHPRTASQLYEGDVDLSTLNQCLADIKSPVIYNGDIRTWQDFFVVKSRFPEIKSWMIGRGIIADPFLASELKNQGSPLLFSSIEKTRIVESYINDLFDSYNYGSRRQVIVLGLMKEVWRYLAGSFVDGRHMLRRILETNSVTDYKRTTYRFFSGGAEWNGPGK